MHAAELLQEAAHYYLARDQQTVPQLDGQYTLLSDRGAALLDDVLQHVRQGDFRGTFKKWRWVPVPSGPWISEDGVDPVLGVRAIFQTHYNRAVSGKLEGGHYRPRECTQTSNVLLHGEGWVYTVSGGLYALGKQKSGAEPEALLLKQETPHKGPL